VKGAAFRGAGILLVLMHEGPAFFRVSTDDKIAGETSTLETFRDFASHQNFPES
jgi:hypothetical protein